MAASSSHSYPVPYVKHLHTETSSPVQQEPNSGWAVFHTTDHREQSNNTGSIPFALREAFASSDESKASQPSNNNSPTSSALIQAADGNGNKEKITSMFRANSYNGNERSTSLFQARPSSRPPSATSNQQRPSTATPCLTGQTEPVAGAIMSSIFSINKVSYDVHLFDNRITWVPVSQKPKRRSSSNLFGESNKKPSTVETGVIYLHDLCSVKLKNVKSVRSGSSTTIGFAVFMAQQRSGNKFREKSVVFLCFSRDICIQWATRIKKYILENFNRPKRLLVLSSGTMTATQIWDDVVEPKLDIACVKSKYIDVDKGESALEHVQNLLLEQSTSPESDSYDGLLVLGKVSLFSEVLNLMIKYKEKTSANGAWNTNLLPIGFVPTAMVSFVANEIHGTSDTETAIFNIIYGCTRDMPVCQFCDQDGQLLKYGLTASYGFSGGDTVRKSSSKGLAGMQGSIKKGFAVTKAIMKRRSYVCKIQYRDGFPADFPAEDDEMYARIKAKDYSIVNEHFVGDENGECSQHDLTNGSGTRDTDSGIWPKNETWNSVGQDNFVDITVTSLPQYDEAYSDECPLSAILLRDSSRKDLFLGMGSQVSLSSTTSKHKPEAQSKTEIVHGSEFIVKPVTDFANSTASSGPSRFSTWTVDGCCVNAGIQEMHVKVHDARIVLYGRAPYQPLALPPTQNVLKLEENAGNVTLDSVV